MCNEIVTFDPDGDLSLRLSYPPDESQSSTSISDDGETDLGPLDSEPQETPVVVTPPETLRGLGDLDQDTISNGGSKAREQVDMLVSSKHLMLSSPVFKAMLQPGSFAEGSKLQAGGKVIITLPEDNPEAFTILLNIVHGKVRQLPAEVPINIMTGLSVLIDKYQMHEAGELCLRLWMPELKKSLPTKLDETMLSWLSISWVFKLPDVFKKITRIAENETCDHLAKAGAEALPIPSTVLDKIDQHRKEGITVMLSYVTKAHDTFRKKEGYCKSLKDEDVFSCGGMMLGTLLKSALDVGLLPLPEVPYTSRSINQTADDIKKLRIMSLCGPQPSLLAVNLRPGHGWPHWLNENVSKVEKKYEGLDLADFA
ncbi:hypothetical protein BKA64DRAFT_752556 [Cadophora sp. MPI-SDFR-AT-0126]|nr:hypothetical protein BKA64DRAFT_752556 [Leotiomycetes sp. MPI-SDFR-AT-0126]